MSDSFAAHYLEDVVRSFRKVKTLAEKAAAQLDDEEFFRAIDEESNSVALIMKHMSGNMRSRWTDFLTTDGEKPDRDRESEFVANADEDRRAIIERWETGWACVFKAIESLGPGDLMRTVTIRHEPHTVVSAINRQVEHYAHHGGQIVFLSKHLKSGAWQTLSIPRGGATAFNKEMREKHSKS
ncbi:MAG: DUF1572 domain-containing protein [Acidobacteria bacterium]|nr:DUF1572 domain-containing protein [Acidobacteriota bacterium]